MNAEPASFFVLRSAFIVSHALTIPYWFPLLVSALLLLGAWRKTRRRDNPATAFPVVLRA